MPHTQVDKVANIPKARIAKRESRRQIAIVCFVSIVASFDFLIYVHLAETTNHIFFSSTQSTFIEQLHVLSVISAGYIARPIGGLLFGSYGDLQGRRRGLLLSLTFLTATTLLTACAPTFNQLGVIATLFFVTVRLLQGMAFGALIPLSWVFIVEYVTRRNLASYCGLIASCIIIGNLIAVIFFRILNDALLYSAIINFGWRIPFVIGGLMSLVALVLCRRISETPEFLVMQDIKQQTPHHLSLTPTFNRPYNILLITGLNFILASIIMMLLVLLPKLIDLTFDIDASLLTFANILGLFFMALGCIFFGNLGDRIGIGKAITFGSLVFMLQTLLFYSQLVVGNGAYILILYALLGFSCGFVGLCLSIIIQMFPTRIRALGVSVFYNSMFAIAGALIPFGLFYAIRFTTLAPAVYLLFIALLATITGIHLTNKPIAQTFDTPIG